MLEIEGIDVKTLGFARLLTETIELDLNRFRYISELERVQNTYKYKTTCLQLHKLILTTRSGVTPQFTTYLYMV